MPSKSKAKGNRFERLCVDIAKESNIKAVRAWGSDGRSLGEHSEVDVMLGTNVDFQLVKEDRGQIYAILTYESLLKLIE